MPFFGLRAWHLRDPWLIGKLEGTLMAARSLSSRLKNGAVPPDTPIRFTGDTSERRTDPFL